MSEHQTPQNDDATEEQDVEKLPDPELVPKATRRKLTGAFKLRVLQDLDELRGSGQIGAYLRENGLYSAQVSAWRQALADGGPEALEPKRRGRPPKSTEQREYDDELARLRAENARLQKKLAQAEVIIDVQKKLADYVSMTLDGEDSK